MNKKFVVYEIKNRQVITDNGEESVNTFFERGEFDTMEQAEEKVATLIGWLHKTVSRVAAVPEAQKIISETKYTILPVYSIAI